jgi:hypothetical protein
MFNNFINSRVEKMKITNENERLPSIDGVVIGWVFEYFILNIYINLLCFKKVWNNYRQMTQPKNFLGNFCLS